jgi:hypothetical protein
MKTKITIYIILLCPFLFACDNNDDVVENVLYDYEVLMKTEYYQNLIKRAECTNIPRPDDTYIYPVVPGTDEWMKLHQKGMDEVRKACIVPAKFLKKQSTQAVIQTYLDYPFLGDIDTSSSTLLNGYKSSSEYNSAHEELLKRNDAGRCLLETYTVFNPAGCIAFILTGIHLEMLLAQPEFYSQLNTNEKKTLVKEVLRKTEIRLNYDYSSHTLYETPGFLMGRMMVSANFSPFIKEVNKNKLLAQYLETQDIEFSDYDIIISYANQFIN